MALAAVLGVALVAADAAPVEAQSRPDSFAELAEQLSPSVVNITTSQTVTEQNPGLSPMIPEGSPFEDFFRDFMERQPGQPRQRRATALGSGFVISADGYIVTNNHVIEQADEILVEFLDGGELEAEIIGTDPRTDIALLKVEPNDALEYVEFGDSDLARVGDWVLAIGNPLGQGFSVSAGIVSARNRELSGSYDDFIQTDAAINRGNSGGPLFNMDGEVIGVNTAILSPNGGSIGIGFSMSSAVVTGVVDQLREFGETRRGWLGVRIQPVDEGVAEALGLEEARGALVADVPPGPAADAGIEAGDVILTFDGTEIGEMRELPRVVADTAVGKSVRVVVFREGRTRTLNVSVGRLEDTSVVEASMTDEGPGEGSSVAEIAGLTLETMSDALREEFGIPDDVRGVVITDVDGTSAAWEKGLRPGQVVVEVGQRSVASPSDVQEAVEAAGDAGRNSVLMLIRDNGEPRFVALDPNG
ncbi:DegQ family serine endoprotease [Pontivivens ytuae]|uniref:Probable periplasmic serine endoprotease DegP-like n=1 Tax=Pontivivens ytuae TaxID=2789856 RepID=A0A7S9QF81_9RHOB|nr:DegQ family serine endoprotease [Pontivivens ytuae]QPH56227.1 DegQ family serine endoprotease [Pontivivens ytuae]